MTGFAVGLVVVRRIAIAASDQALESVRPENQAAAHAFTDRVLGNLLVYTGWLLAVVLVVLVIAWLTGSYPAPRRHPPMGRRTSPDRSEGRSRPSVLGLRRSPGSRRTGNH